MTIRQSTIGGGSFGIVARPANRDQFRPGPGCTAASEIAPRYGPENTFRSSGGRRISRRVSMVTARRNVLLTGLK